NANAMVDGLEQSWTKLASGAEAAQKAAQGFLVIAGLKGRTSGHVAVVISGPLYRQKYPMCWCGSIAGAVGQSQGLKSVGQVWNRTDRDRLNY
ncbi:type VI secretion system effector peptidoglycanhydrolase Tse1, partial [Acinetobacter baumannii]